MTNDHLARRVACAALLPASLCVPPSVMAFGFSSTTKQVDTTHLVKHMAECGPFKLKELTEDAAARTRTYWFDGICKIWVVHVQGGQPQGKTGEASLWAEARVTWHATSNRLEELVKLTDPAKKHSDTLRSGFKCLSDPVVQSAQCVQLEFKNLTDWAGFSVPADKNRPLLQGAASSADVNRLAQAQKRLSSPSARPAPDAARPDLSSAGASTAAKAAAIAAGVGAALPSAGGPLPDLTSSTQLVVAGKHKVIAGSTVTLADTDARAAANGVCQVAIEHEIRNTGKATSPASHRQWTIEGSPGALMAQTPPIAAGATLSRVDTLGLRPGENQLKLRLDPHGQLKEVSDANNGFTLTITVAGLCGGAPTSQPQAAAADNLRFGRAQDGAAQAAQGRLRLPSTSR